MGAILIVDDEKNIRESLAMYIQSLGHTSETAVDAERPCKPSTAGTSIWCCRTSAWRAWAVSDC